MLKQILVILSLIQVIHCLSVRNNAWSNRRDEHSQTECELDLNNDNPSLEGKICGYCYAKCQQQLASCLLAQLTQAASSSTEYCENNSKKCERNCLHDKRSSRVAEANWSKVLAILRQFQMYSLMQDGKKQ